MQRFALALVLLLLAANSGAQLAQAPAPPGPASAPRLSWPAGLPVYDHIVIVIEENKNYQEILGKRAATPFIKRLKGEGADLTRMYAEEHNSEGNYFWLFSGSNQGVGFKDKIPAGSFFGPQPGRAADRSRALVQGVFRGPAEHRLSSAEEGFVRP